MDRKRAGRAVAWVAVALAYGYYTVYEGVLGFVRGYPAAAWLPGLSMGVLVGAFLVAITLASRVGDDPAEGGFSPAHWAAVACFALFVIVGLTLLSAGLSTIESWAHVAVGAGGLLLMLREGLIRSSRPAG